MPLPHAFCLGETGRQNGKDTQLPSRSSWNAQAQEWAQRGSQTRSQFGVGRTTRIATERWPSRRQQQALKQSVTETASQRKVCLPKVNGKEAIGAFGLELQGVMACSAEVVCDV